MTRSTQHADRAGVTWRAVLVAWAVLLIAVPIAFYVDVAWNKAEMFVGVPSMTPVVLLFVLTAGGSIPFLRRLSLTRREALTTYSIVLVAGPLIGATTLGWMLVATIQYYYFARAYTIWETTFLHQVPPWFAPTDPAAAEAFFHGGAVVPWALWWRPLGAWSFFMVTLFLCVFCIIALFQRQWITHERLSFPLAQVPLTTVGGTGPTQPFGAPKFPLSWAFWIGLIISFGLTSLDELSRRWPTVPALPLGPLPILQEQRAGPLAGMGEVVLLLWPWMIAIAYLIPKELSFSAWFFWWALVGVNTLAVMAGTEPRGPAVIWDSTFPAPRYQGGGAVVLMGLWAVWIARRHFAQVLRSALSRRTTLGEESEPLPYRLALIGMLLTFVAMVYFCCAAGCRLVVALTLIGAIIGYYVVWARLRAETGLGFSTFPLGVFAAMRVPFGAAVFRTSEFVVANSLRWAYAKGGGWIYESCTGNTLEAMKIADSAGISKRRLTAAILIGLLLTLAAAIFVFLTGIYHYGWFELQRLNVGFMREIIADGNRIVAYLMNPNEPDANGVVAIGAGAAIAALLGAMRLRFWWWPFHPVGYMAAMCWGLNWYWMPFFVGWAAKTLILRYGGLRLYRTTIPLAIAFIVGELLSRGTWAAIALATLGRI
jgi:hypothetical protein